MSPLDDEVRSLLQSKAAGVDPAPDPLGGIESRARGLRRRRVLTSVSGAAAVVVAVAVAVPLLVSGSDTATRQPGGTPTPTAETPFRPANLLPWPRPEALEIFGSSINYLSPIGRLMGEPDYARVGYQPLWTGSVEGSAAVTVGEAWKGTEPARLVTVGAGDQLGPVVDPSQSVVAFAVGGDKGTLIVVAAPDAVVEYAADGSSYQQISDVGQAPKGIGLVPIEAEDPNDTIRVTEADGSVVVQPAPDWTPVDTTTPVNVLDTWVHRGYRQVLSTAAVVHAYEQATGLSGGGQYRSLYDGSHLGVSFTIGQAWTSGEPAHTVALLSDGTFFLGPVTPRDPWLLGTLLATRHLVGSDLLVLLPRPGAGRIGYSPDGTSPFTDVANGRSDLNPVAVLDRDPKATADRVQVHRGDDSVILTEGIAKLTCGAKDCG
jgi:hypothetical protein